MPNLFDIWQDLKTNNTMFCKDLDHQGVVGSHLLDYMNGIWTTLRTPRPHLTWFYIYIIEHGFHKKTSKFYKIGCGYHKRKMSY